MLPVLYGMSSVGNLFFLKIKEQEKELLINMVAFSSAKDQILRGVVAVRKVTKPFGSSILAKRALREIKLLRYLRHENVWTSVKSANRRQTTRIATNSKNRLLD